MGYLSGYDTEDGVALEAIHVERRRQEELKEQGKFAFTCADPMLDVEKLGVLAEEAGEVAKAVNELNAARNATKRKRWRNNLREELVQTAAVCVAWIEAIDKGA